jgi:hypothetical protein
MHQPDEGAVRIVPQMFGRRGNLDIENQILPHDKVKINLLLHMRMRVGLHAPFAFTGRYGSYRTTTMLRYSACRLLI